jgi:hypothetical protein
VLYLENTEFAQLHQVQLQQDNSIILPDLVEYPPYFNILDYNQNPLFASVFVAKKGILTKPTLYTSMTETFVILKPVGFPSISFMLVEAKDLTATITK